MEQVYEVDNLYETIGATLKMTRHNHVVGRVQPSYHHVMEFGQAEASRNARFDIATKRIFKPYKRGAMPQVITYNNSPPIPLAALFHFPAAFPRAAFALQKPLDLPPLRQPPVKRPRRYAPSFTHLAHTSPAPQPLHLAHAGQSLLQRRALPLRNRRPRGPSPPVQRPRRHVIPHAHVCNAHAPPRKHLQTLRARVRVVRRRRRHVALILSRTHPRRLSPRLALAALKVRMLVGEADPPTVMDDRCGCCDTNKT